MVWLWARNSKHELTLHIRYFKTFHVATSVDITTNTSIVSITPSFHNTYYINFRWLFAWKQKIKSFLHKPNCDELSLTWKCFGTIMMLLCFDLVLLRKLRDIILYTILVHVYINLHCLHCMRVSVFKIHDDYRNNNILCIGFCCILAPQYHNKINRKVNVVWSFT